jgi:Protein of unknown function (DUF1682)
VPLSHDGGAVYQSYATGRVGIRRLWIEITTVSRHDVVSWLAESIGSFFFDIFGPGEDLVEVTIEPSAEWEGFTWAVVRKGKMRKLGESRYDLVCCPPLMSRTDLLMLAIYEIYRNECHPSDIGNSYGTS